MTPDLLKLAADMRKRAAAQREISGRASGSEVRYSMALDYEADSLDRFATELERIAQAGGEAVAWGFRRAGSDKIGVSTTPNINKEMFGEVDVFPLYSSPAPVTQAAPNIDALVDKFLSWPLPDSVCSDQCATMRGYPNRCGTNLLTAPEARQMIEHLLAPPTAEKSEAASCGTPMPEIPVAWKVKAKLGAVSRMEPPAADQDGWIPWAGGDIPVEINARVIVRLQCGSEEISDAGNFCWGRTYDESDIIAYRVVKEGEK